jgi:hypothetical protein
MKAGVSLRNPCRCLFRSATSYRPDRRTRGKDPTRWRRTRRRLTMPVGHMLSGGLWRSGTFFSVGSLRWIGGRAATQGADRQTNSFIENSKEVGILLCGNAGCRYISAAKGDSEHALCVSSGGHAKAVVPETEHHERKTSMPGALQGLFSRVGWCEFDPRPSPTYTVANY